MGSVGGWVFVVDFARGSVGKSIRMGTYPAISVTEDAGDGISCAESVKKANRNIGIGSTRRWGDVFAIARKRFPEKRGDLSRILVYR